MQVQSAVKPKLSWEQVLSQFQDLIKFAARQAVENNPSDTMVSAEDLYQEGMIKLYDCWLEWCVEKGKDMDEFGPIFRKSLFRAVKRKRGVQRNHSDLEKAINIMEDGSTPEVSVDRMYQEEGISRIRVILGSGVARKLFDELLDPSPQSLYEAWADVKRKEMLKSQGKRVNIPKDTRVRAKHIIRCLGISTKQYDTAITEIRAVAREVLGVQMGEGKR